MATSEKPFENLETQEQIEAIMRPGGDTVILDFWSETCGPCMAMAQDFEHVATQFDPEEIRFCKVNVGTHGHLAAPFKVQSVPTILFIHNGNIVDVVVGKLSATDLGKKSESLLKRATKKPSLLSRLFG